jgi:hypothetical protein
MTAKTAPKQTKADFVRSADRRLSAKDVVAKAKAAGIALTDTYVYNVRGAAKAAASKAAAKPAAPVKAPVAHAVAKSGVSAGPSSPCSRRSRPRSVSAERSRFWWARGPECKPYSGLERAFRADGMGSSGKRRQPEDDRRVAIGSRAEPRARACNRCPLTG